MEGCIVVLLQIEVKNPIDDKVNWELAFASNNDSESKRAFLGYISTSGDLRAESNYKYYFTNSATIILPETSEKGDTIIVSKSPIVTVSAVVDGGEEIYTHKGYYFEVIFDVYDEINFIYNGINWEVV